MIDEVSGKRDTQLVSGSPSLGLMMGILTLMILIIILTNNSNWKRGKTGKGGKTGTGLV